MEKEDAIKELGPNEDMDYLYILRALNEIRFPVGKNLLIGFLIGDMKNQSVIKNDLFTLHTFKSLRRYSDSEIRSMIDNLIANSMVDSSSIIGNKFAQVYAITQKGQEELMTPSLYKKKISNQLDSETVITDREKVLFKELDFFLSGFNDEQKKAIIMQNPRILCVAGAGSGKTTVLVKRIEFLVKYQSANPHKILAITFTRKARQEMEHRLIALGITGVQIETFNSFSEKMLQRFGHLIYSSQKRVMSYTDKIIAMNFAMAAMNLDMDSATNKYFTDNQKKNKEPNQLNNIFMNDCFSVIEYFKSKKEKLHDFSVGLNGEERENAKMIAKVCQNLETQMKMQGLRDYTDQILDTIELFNKDGRTIPIFDSILVDEYQDVNAMQIELLDLLIQKNKSVNLFVVGDPRQSIFGWRGSNVGYILNFKDKFGNCEIINLFRNYRSGDKIVKFMNHSIESMKMQDIESCNPNDSTIKIIDFSSEDMEWSFVMNEIKKLIDNGMPGDNIFVLSRTNRQLNDLSQRLRAAQIPHVVKTDELKRPTEARIGDVTLATIHAIKGLEAKVVFVIGCTEQNFPCKASDHPVIEIAKMGITEYDKEEEEKRLFYVAISRAKEKLYLSYSGKKHTYFINDEMKKMLNDWF